MLDRRTVIPIINYGDGQLLDGSGVMDGGRERERVREREVCAR